MLPVQLSDRRSTSLLVSFALVVALAAVGGACSSDAPASGDDRSPLDAASASLSPDSRRASAVDSGAASNDSPSDDASTTAEIDVAPPDAGDVPDAPDAQDVDGKAMDGAVGRVDASSSVRTLAVLLVGNSQLTNDLPSNLQKFSESVAGGPRLKVEAAVTNGTGLIGYWNRGTGAGTPRAIIAARRFDVVVLQEAFDPEPANIRTYSRLFYDLAKKTGSGVAMFATASINSKYPSGFDKLHGLNLEMAQTLKVPLAAGGETWRAWWGPAPTEPERLRLYADDKVHPGPRGSYLYACALYAALTGTSPEGATFVFGGMSPDEGARARKMAWETYRRIEDARR